ncbi:MAG: hypothetical protein BJ554DRAFT_4808 [Olpidium bornovanus]|uniref:Uncharacterized protein n=1 Tax=Olpidium bornovanus TaxID=278681 RepID=A0A8H8DLR6_9FUNG|nr:MAG: hypothetical protein BJ554DRAFT_4808 [Olpidium bornovanus]
MSLFPGLGFAAGYKVLQRNYKFGGQPVVIDYLNAHHKKTYGFVRREDREGNDARDGDKVGRGELARVLTRLLPRKFQSLVGIGEVVLLPLDVLKIKRQTNPVAFKGRGVFTIFREEGRGLYRGAGWTATRNAPGSFALFGGAAFVKKYIFHLKDYSEASFLPEFCRGDRRRGRVNRRVLSAGCRKNAYPEPFKAQRGDARAHFSLGLIPKIVVVGPKLFHCRPTAYSRPPQVLREQGVRALDSCHDKTVLHSISLRADATLIPRARFLQNYQDIDRFAAVMRLRSGQVERA